MRSATVVLPVPGLPVKLMCRLGPCDASPCPSRSRSTTSSAAMSRMRCLTGASPTRSCSSSSSTASTCESASTAPTVRGASAVRGAVVPSATAGRGSGAAAGGTPAPGIA